MGELVLERTHAQYWMSALTVPGGCVMLQQSEMMTLAAIHVGFGGGKRRSGNKLAAFDQD